MPTRRSPQPRFARALSWRAIAASVVSAVLVVTPVAGLPLALAADPLEPVLIELSKEAVPVPPDAAIPGETVSYSFTVTCSSTQTDCVNMVLTDSFPEPLEFVSVSASTNFTIGAAPNGFALTFTNALDEGGVGLVAGESVSFTATAIVPTDADAAFDGTTVTNTAFVTVDNPDSNVSDAADTLLDIPLTVGSTIAKAVSPSSVAGLPGTEVAFELSATNASNTSADSLVIQDPATLPSNAWDYLDVTGLDGVQFPEGADRVQVDWLDGTTWNLGSPAATATLPADLAPIDGLRFTFTSTTGGIDRDAEAAVTIVNEVSDNALDLTADFTGSNVASSFVTADAATGTTVVDTAPFTIRQARLTPTATKQFSDRDIVGGQDLVVTLGAENSGDFTVERLSVVEPAASTPSLEAQGLEFDAWLTDDIEWPVGATSVEVSYLYDDGGPISAPLTANAGEPWPNPVGADPVVGFRVDFFGDIAPAQYAVLPFAARTVTVPSGNVATTNEITVEVENAAGSIATDNASDDLIRRSARINTSIEKIFSPEEIYSVAGASALLALNAQVDPRPVAGDTGGSTIGVERFIVRDDDAAFFNDFNLTAIVATDVPANSSLTVRYFDGSSWVNLPGSVGLVGPQSVSSVIPSGLRDDIRGIEFEFTPTGSLDALPPGFSVQPNLRVSLRDQQRDGSGDAADPDALANRIVADTAESIVENPVATPATATATDDDEITLLPVDGDGPTMLNKVWQDNATTLTDAVRARSGDRDIATLEWGTGGLDYDSVVISDTADDPATTDVADTVFEAFNLRRIPAISSAMDPLLTFDRVQSVELYRDGTGWVATATNPCAGSACDGTFPGYTLTASEQASTIGVRLTLEESPTRAARSAGVVTAPPVGSGVAASMALDREIDLEFEVRDTRRSNGEAVLGFTRGALYNLADPGEVNNTARLEGFDASDTLVYDDTASDAITILDRAINVNASKSWSETELGVPPTGTPQALFPKSRVTIAGQNTSVVRVNELGVAEPTTGTNPFDFVNLADIVSITVPTGATASIVTLDYDGSPSADFSIAAALALDSTALENVIGIEVVHTGRIDASATTTIVFDAQLREFERGTATRVDETVTPIDNTITASVVDPGGLTSPVSGTDNIVTDEASDDIAVATFDFGVTATKSIVADTTATPSSPAIQYEDAATTALVTLSGQPSGNVRATELVIEDDAPSFWNAYNFDGFGPGNLTPQSPINRVQTDALVGITYDVDAGTNDITPLCAGDTDLTACWILGTPATTLTMPALGANTLEDIRGLRFTYTKADGSTFERPYNPLQRVSFTVERRTNLVAPSSSPVPSTYFEFTEAAPGESEPGIFTNEVDVTASTFTAPGSSTPAWPSATDSDSKQIRFQHLPGRVEVQKTEFGAKSLGTDIPYRIIVTNTGGALDRALPNLVVTDQLPGNGSVPMLVIPNDPDTGAPYANGEAFSYSLKNAAGVAQPAPTVTVVEGPASGAGRTLTFSLVSPATLPTGWELTIATTLRFVDTLEAGTLVTNSATVTSDRAFDACDSFTDETTQNAQETFVASCESTTTVWPLAAAPVSIVKGVRGVEAGPLDTNGDPLLDGDGNPFDDLGIIKTIPGSSVDCSAPNVSVDGAPEYYRFPCVPITRPGGTEEWASTFTNGGNIDIVELAAIDVLPRPGDRGVIVNEARSSKWTPTLTTYPEIVGLPSGSSYDVYFVATTGIATTRCNGADIQSELGMTTTSSPPINPSYAACLSDTGKVDDVPNRAWQLLPTTADAATLASVVAMKFVVDMPNGLAPGGRLGIVYQSRTAAAPELAESATTIARDSIAYNSIAGAAVGHDGTTRVANRFVIEPRKVGVAMATGELELAKIVNGPAFASAPANFTMTLSCTSVGESVPIRNADGSTRNPFTVSGSGAATLVQGLPLYADCSVDEGNFGQSQESISPATVTAQAGHSTSQTVYDPHPAFDAGGVVERPAIERTTVTNTYENAGFVVSKNINNGGAVDAAGTPIAYANFVFSASCTFNNGVSTSTTLASTSFTLANASATRAFTGIPAGSVCTVTETTTRSAASTTYVETVGGVAEPSVTGTTSVFTLAPDSGLGASTNAVAFTNNFGVGSLALSKVVAGPGAAYATSDFDVRVRCTRAISSGTASVVYDRTFTFNAANGFSTTISNLATGASCAITEPDSGGATTTALPSNATIGNGTTVSRTVTNTFQLASLRVTKDVHQVAVDENGDPVDRGAFPMTVTCTFEGNAVWATGFSSSPMTFDLFDTENAADVRSRTLTGLPAGASCVVAEGATPGADSTDIALQSATASSVVPGKTATIVLTPTTSTPALNTATVNNRYEVTSFTVTKERLGAGAAQFGDGPFTIDVECTAPGGISAFADEITLPTAGGAWFETIDDLAEDAECSAVESNFAATGANAVVYRDTDGDEIAEGDTVLSTLVEPASITIENWFLTGEVSITKTLAGAGSPQYSAGPFEVTLECERDGIAVTIPGGATRVLEAGSMTATFTSIADGATCELTETVTGGATSSSIAIDGGATVATDATEGYSFDIDVDNSDLSDDQPQPALIVENTFELASLAVSKTVESDAVDESGTPVSYGPFPITVDCLFEGESVFADGFSAATPMRHDIADGETWNLEGLPAGASCEVTETDAVSSSAPSITVTSGSGTPVETTGTTATGVSGSLTLAPGGNTADIVNPFDVGSISLRKVVTGLGGDNWGTADFTIEVSCLLSDGSGIRSVFSDSFVFDSASDEVIIENLAEGATCDIEETLTGGADSTSIDIDGTSTDGTLATLTVTDAASPALVVVTNVFPLSEIAVSKVIDGAGALLYGAGPFEVTLECSLNINGDDVELDIPGGATRTLDSVGGYTASYTELPTGADCSIEESLTGGADATVIDQPSFTLADVPTEVVITNTFDVGAIAITKTVDGAGAGLWGNGDFEVTIDCSRIVDGVSVPFVAPGGNSRPLTAAGGYIARFDELPARAECAIAESVSAGATLATISADSVTIPASADVAVSMTNTFEVAALTIAKTVIGTAAGEHLNEAFTVELECELPVDGVMTTLEVPGGAARSFEAGESATWENLPVAASCAIDETENGGANSMVLTAGVLPVAAVVAIDADGTDLGMANVFMADLAITGVDLFVGAVVAALLLALGMLLLLAGRKRRVS